MCGLQVFFLSILDLLCRNDIHLLILLLNLERFHGGEVLIFLFAPFLFLRGLAELGR